MSFGVGETPKLIIFKVLDIRMLRQHDKFEVDLLSSFLHAELESNKTKNRKLCLPNQSTLLGAELMK